MIERSEAEVAVIARFTAKAGKAEELKAALHHAIGLGLNEPGCKRLILYQDADNPAVFTVIEKFADEAAFQAHLDAPYTVQLLGEVIPALTEGQSISKHREVIVHAAESVPA